MSDQRSIDKAKLTSAAIKTLEKATATQDLALLDESLSQFEYIFGLMEPSETNYHASVGNLANALLTKAIWTDDLALLDRSLELIIAALGSGFLSKERRAMLLGGVGLATRIKGIRSGNSSEIADAAAKYRDALRLTSKKVNLHLDHLSELAMTLVYHFSIANRQSSIYEAIRTADASVSRTPNDDPALANRLSILGAAQLSLAGFKNDAAVMAKAVENSRRAVNITPQNSPEAPQYLSNLGIALMREYERSDSMGSLEESIQVHRTAVAQTPDWHVDRPARLTNLGFALMSLFERRGDDFILDEIVQIFRDSVALANEDSAVKVKYLYGLASALRQRGMHIGDMSSLIEATDLLREVVRLTAENHPDRAGRLSGLASVLYQRFQEDPDDLTLIEEAVSLQRQAVSRIAKGHVLRGMLLSNLGGILDSRAEWADSLDALKEAVEFHRMALDATVPGHSERPKHMANLAISLLLMSRFTASQNTLPEALDLVKKALDSLSADDLCYANTLIVLGAVYERKFQFHNDRQTLAMAIQAFQMAADSDVASVRTRIDAGLRGGRLAATAEVADKALIAFSTAIRLIDEAMNTGLGRRDQERLLSEIAGLPMDAAAMAIITGRLEYAVELLEQGRGVFIASQLEAPGLHRQLRDKDPQLAEDLDSLRRRLEAIDGLVAVPGSDEQANAVTRVTQISDERNALARRRRSLVDKIRHTPGLENFGDPPKFAELCEAAVKGPVAILNISTYRCDALLVSNDSVQLVELPTLTLESVRDQTVALTDDSNITSRVITETLEWLWGNAVEPILLRLGAAGCRDDEELTRIWWCGTGLSGFLPFHAAGRYPEDGSATFTALDLVVSSYTPSLRSLIQLRRRSQSPEFGNTRPLIIALPDKPNAAQLEGARREIDYLKARFPDHTLLLDSTATREAVINVLPEYSWAHFSCHGRQDLAAPLEGKLLLYDQPLMVEQIMRLDLARASFAFLSSCETYRVGTRIPDEGLTIASALLLAGYRHVIATLWSVGIVTAEIAEHFYEEIVRHQGTTVEIDVNDAAYALRKAIISFRHRDPSVPPSLWAPYIHAGP